MATTGTQEFFELWRKQMEASAQAWTNAAGQAAAASQPDPLKLWRPFIDQASDMWAKSVKASQPSGTPDVVAQGKAFLDQWIGAWDKVLADAMKTEAFAKAMGGYLDQWLTAQAPVRKAAADQMEQTLQALGVASRAQVVAIARQLMDLDDRLEAIEDGIAALRTANAPREPERPAPRRGQPGKGTERK